MIIEIHNPWTKFWTWVARFAYRRVATPIEKMPVGIPHVRDPEHPCPVYEPRLKMPADFGDCQGDGHYLCAECCHLVNDNAED